MPKPIVRCAVCKKFINVKRDKFITLKNPKDPSLVACVCVACIKRQQEAMRSKPIEEVSGETAIQP